MQTVDALLERVQRLGVHLSVHDDELELEGPADKLDDDLVDELRNHKAAIIRHLTPDDDEQPPEPAPPQALQISADDVAANREPGFLTELIGIDDELLSADPADDEGEQHAERRDVDSTTVSWLDRLLGWDSRK